MKRLLLILAALAIPLALAQDRPIHEQMNGKSKDEKVSMKSDEIMKKTRKGSYSAYGVTVEIQNVEKIEGGIQVLARGWKGNKQLGFGKDGSVEIERFKFYNPPILVDDPNGTIVREWVEIKTGLTRQRKLREDPEQALKETLAHTISLVGKEDAPIVAGKVGHTTSTFYPDADPETNTVDGHGTNTTAASFSTLRSATPGTVNDSAATVVPWDMRSTVTTDTYDRMFRSIFGFNTAAIPDTDAVSSATLSFYGNDKADFFSQSVVIDRAVPVSATSLAATDFELADYAGVEQSSTRITTASWSTTGYNDFTLNATGISNISLTGVSWYGGRASSDFDNSAPTWVSNKEGYVQSYSADQTGTSNDPKLVVVHDVAPVASPRPPPSPIMF